LPVEAEIAQTGVIAALLHDSGKLVLASRLPEAFEQALRKSREEGRPLHDVEEELIGSTHAEIGAYLLSLWGLPQTIVDAVWSHHRPSAAQHATEGLDVLAVTHIAHALAVESELGVPLDAEPSGALWDLKYLEELNLTSQIPQWRQIAAAAVLAGAGKIS
jgi:HD-like signal output (HDOD) protein